ncbi:MAG: hypothetical protein K2N74_04840, partial [Clostridiales bacterium]|nr:hypothetical protein [Clostridiales bacterium]
MKSQAYLEEIRKADGLKRAVLQKITIDGREATFHLITDLSYTAEDVAYADRVSARYAPEGYSGRARVTKSVPSAEGVRRALADILKTKFPAAAAFVSPEDITVTVENGGGRFYVDVDGGDSGRISADSVLDVLQKTIARSFCGTWCGEFRITQKDKGEIEFEVEPVEFELSPRYFK